MCSAWSPAGRFVKLILMVTPLPPLTSAMTAVPTLAPFASFKETVTGLVAAEEGASSQEPVARMQRVRIVMVDMQIVYRKKPGARSQEPECARLGVLLAPGFWLLAPLLLD